MSYELLKAYIFTLVSLGGSRTWKQLEKSRQAFEFLICSFSMHFVMMQVIICKIEIKKVVQVY